MILLILFIILQSGIAGALSKIKLGSAASAGNAVIEDHLRRQSWEQGVIDYMGRDAFTNIWDKICQTVGGPSQPEIPEETVESTSEAPADINLVATSASTEQVSVTAVQTSIVGSTKTEVSQPQPVKQAQSGEVFLLISFFKSSFKFSAFIVIINIQICDQEHKSLQTF